MILTEYRHDQNGQADPIQEIEAWIDRYTGPARITLVRQGGPAGNDLRRFLVPLDGTPASEQILTVATELALRYDAMLGLMRVVPYGAGESHRDTEQVEQQRDEAREYLDRVARRVRNHGVSATWEVRIGGPGQEIARAAETTAADLIIMASQHFSGDMNHGNTGVTDAAIRATNIPVIVATLPAYSHQVKD